MYGNQQGANYPQSVFDNTWREVVSRDGALAAFNNDNRIQGAYRKATEYYSRFINTMQQQNSLTQETVCNGAFTIIRGILYDFLFCVTGQMATQYANDYANFCRLFNESLSAPTQQPTYGGNPGGYGMGGSAYGNNNYGMGGGGYGYQQRQPLNSTIQSTAMVSGNGQQGYGVASYNNNDATRDNDGMLSDFKPRRAAAPEPAVPAQEKQTPASAPVPKRKVYSSKSPEKEMDIKDHLSENDVIDVADYDFLSDAARGIPQQKVPEKKPKTSITNIGELRMTTPSGEIIPVISVLYEFYPASRTKPVVYEEERLHYIPLFEPSEALKKELAQIAELKDFDEMCNFIDDLSTRYSIKGIVDWIDTSLCRLFETMLHQIYDVSENVHLFKYLRDRPSVDGFLSKRGAKKYLHAAAVNWLKKAFNECMIEDVSVNLPDVAKTEASFLKMVIVENVLFIPKKMIYNYCDNSIWIESVDDDEMVSLFDQTFSMLDEDFPYITLASNSGTRYRVWRCNASMHAPSRYFIEDTTN